MTENEIVEKIQNIKIALEAYDTFEGIMEKFCEENNERFTNGMSLRTFETRMKNRLTKLRLELMEVRGE